MDHSDLIEELPVIEKLTPAERIGIARQRRALQLLKWQEREKAAGVLSNSSAADGVTVHTLYERQPKISFNCSITLLEATARNDLEEVARLLTAGADPNSHNEDGLTPLHQCAIDNNEPMLQLLLENGADVNARDTELWTPLHAAACCGHAEIVRHLIDRGALLLAVNADGNMPYDICDDEYTLDLIESEMAKRGITQEDIDDERLSTERRMLEDMQDLRDEGGDLEYRDENGATPLHIACANGFYNCAQFLLDCGCSPHVRDNDGWQPVHAAACWAQADILELLVAYGADINALTPMNETALDLCEDEGVRAVLLTLQVELQRRKLLSFGRDSRRMSKRRKPTSKFESPPTANLSGGTENHLASTRGAIRRLSIRDRAGVTLARLEARKEAALMRSFSFEENSNPALGKQEASLELASEMSEKRPVSCPDVSSVLETKSDKPVMNGSDQCDTTERSSATLESVTVNGVDGEAEVPKRAGQSSLQTAESKNGESEARPSGVITQESPPTQELSTTEWLRKIRQEEEQGMMASLERESVSSARKGRRKAPAPIAPAPITANGIPAPDNLKNGQVVSHNRQHSADSLSGGRVLVQRSAVTEMYISQQHTRTLVPGEPTFSRHPMTLIDLKKQRVEDRKTSSPIPRSPVPHDSNAAATPISSTAAGDSDETAKARFRAPSDAVIGRSRSPKLGMRCCRIT